ncbi:hypothetical protein A0H81_07896 [Grifola frondosa]|uniref:Uncharacterized protein n=1 Tax=Grifola frondosa TaxID=5627 RepID=A0A1C7M6P1_GRIFR|nr:hypothetical protein A0H81_07896 [Grifola frondosa]
MIAVARGFAADGTLEEDLEETFRIYFHQSLHEVCSVRFPLPLSSDSDEFIEALTDALSDDVPQAQASRVVPARFPARSLRQIASNTQALLGVHSTTPHQSSADHSALARARSRQPIHASQGSPVQEVIPGTSADEPELPSADEGSSGDETAEEGSGEEGSGDEALSPSPVVYIGKRQM